MMNNPRLLRYLATGLSLIAGAISAFPWHGHTTVIVLSGSFCLLIAIALSFRAHRLTERKPDDP